MTDHRAFAGIFPVLPTPFADDGSIDLDGQRAVVRFALRCGADGVVCFGMGAEVNKLTPGERRRLCEAIVAEVDGRVPVLVGAGAESTHHAVGLAQHARACGAAGIVIPPPMTSNLAGDELDPYFGAIAAAVDLPVMLQNAPEYIGVGLSPDLALRLAAAHPNIRHIKLEAGPDQTERWVAALGPDIRIFTGDAGIHLLGCLRAGAVGNIPAVDVADVLVRAHAAERRGDAAAADAAFEPLLPYLTFALRGIDHCNACTKEVLVQRGILPRGGLRPPGRTLTPFARAHIEACLAGLELG
jgi:dihydrodipicolinate synthase/N-acetylneuraminate lyase